MNWDILTKSTRTPLSSIVLSLDWICGLLSLSILFGLMKTRAQAPEPWANGVPRLRVCARRTVGVGARFKDILLRNDYCTFFYGHCLTSHN